MKKKGHSKKRLGASGTRKPHPKLLPISDQMKAWCAALASEVVIWPQVSARSFLGFTAVYRKDKIFAVLPRTRSMETPNALAFRLDAPASPLRKRLTADPRIGFAQIDKARWFSFELASDSDLHDALEWLARACGTAGKEKKSH